MIIVFIFILVEWYADRWRVPEEGGPGWFAVRVGARRLADAAYWPVIGRGIRSRHRLAGDVGQQVEDFFRGEVFELPGELGRDDRRQRCPSSVR